MTWFGLLALGLWGVCHRCQRYTDEVFGNQAADCECCHGSRYMLRHGSRLRFGVSHDGHARFILSDVKPKEAGLGVQAVCW